MLRCSKRAYNRCPDRYLCGSLADAVFTEHSECADFNRAMEDYSPSPCELCAYDPPSSLDGKPCCFCPAAGKYELEEETT